MRILGYVLRFVSNNSEGTPYFYIFHSSDIYNLQPSLLCTGQTLYRIIFEPVMQGFASYRYSTGLIIHVHFHFAKL